MCFDDLAKILHNFNIKAQKNASHAKIACASMPRAAAAKLTKISPSK
jgi:hypothetical protein